MYDLETDIGEKVDLSADRPVDRARLASLLDDWSDDVAALIPRPNPYPARFGADVTTTA
ncbi:hypothetical protein GCM10025865_14930 [Paraoerskovia sediminicola]|uniref:Uncharacterized protein n=1 Tax=Paraoerskovia sediminicola TaxID=1138587 RepID=A0ABN6XBH4_9CELL|nr:hypothetical protein [Paraoerskovia sediminicola]BDZ42194.1 hypothetical protein GCM10025865_14930 [Paraoerskovia sediminicola]